MKKIIAIAAVCITLTIIFVIGVTVLPNTVNAEEIPAPTITTPRLVYEENNSTVWLSIYAPENINKIRLYLGTNETDCGCYRDYDVNGGQNNTIRISKADLQKTEWKTNNTTKLTELEKNKKYFFRAKSLSNHGTSAYSNYQSVYCISYWGKQ